MDNTKVRKKDGHIEDLDFNKIKVAVTKSARRVDYTLQDDEWLELKNLIVTNDNSYIKKLIKQSNSNIISVSDLHNIIELALDEVVPNVGKSYQNYRNYKKDYAKMMESVLKSADALNYHIDRSNANTSSALISTKRSLVYTALNKELYQKMMLSVDELSAIKDGYIYIHDLGARMDTYNCCLFDIGKVLQGGFTWEHIDYNEPTTVRSAMAVTGDIVLNCAAQQYGGFTLSEIDSVLAPYAEKSYKKYRDEHIAELKKYNVSPDEKEVDEFAINKVKEDLAQGFQAFEHTFNTVASSRGDFPFVTMTGGCDETRFGQLVWETALEVRQGGQGKKGKKRPAIFPKLVFLYTKELHAEGKPLYSLFLKGVACSCKAMYPDWLSLDTPDLSIIDNINNLLLDDTSKTSVVGNIFHKYHKFGVSRWILDDNNKVQENKDWVDSIISPMGKRKLQLI